MATIKMRGGKILLKGGKISCTCCEVCPQPVVRWDSVSASKTKVGFIIKSGPGTFAPPMSDARWLARSQSGTFTKLAGSLRFNTYAGSQTMDRDGNVTGTLTLEDGTCIASSAAGGPNWITSENLLWADRFTGAGSNFTASQINKLAVDGGGVCSLDDVESANTREDLGETSVTYKSDPDLYSGEVTATVADEYTDAALDAFVDEAMGDFPGTWDGTPGSRYSRTPDKLTLNKRKARYQIRFPVPSGGEGSCFIIQAWIVRFTPGDGGDPEDTEHAAVLWDGEVPGGYNPAIESTWPVAKDAEGNPYFEIPTPTVDGEFSIGTMVAGVFVPGIVISKCTGC